MLVLYSWSKVQWYTVVTMTTLIPQGGSDHTLLDNNELKQLLTLIIKHDI